MTDHKQYNIKRENQFLPIEELKKDWATTPTETYTLKNARIRQTLFVNEINTEFLKGQKFNRTLFSTLVSGSVYSVATTDYLIGITSLSYAPSIGLPQPKLVGPGKTYIVKDESGGAATTTITVRSAGEENIDGATTSTLTTNYQAKGFYSDGANWFTR